MQVVVIAPVDEYLSYKEKYPIVRHYSLRMLDRDSTNPLKDLLLLLELIRRYKKIKPDIILHFTNKPNIYGGIAAGFTGIRSIATVTGLGYAFINPGFVSRIMTWLFKISGRFHRKFIFENQEDRNIFIAKGICTLNQSVAVKGCGVDTRYFSPRVHTKQDSKIIFTFIGRLLYDKGIREFVKAASIIKSKFPDVQFWVVGELDDNNPSTVDRDDLVSWIEKGIVFYHGFLKDVRDIITQSDCIVLPSYREGLPRVNIEAMSMAKPVITTDTAGCRETVDDGVNGFLVPAQDENALAAAIEKMLSLSPEARMEMGKNGREKVMEVFADDIIAKDILEVVKSIEKCEKSR